MCEGICKTGVYCNFKGKYLIDGQWYCGFHKKQMTTDIICNSCHCVKQIIIRIVKKTFYCKECEMKSDLMELC